MPKKPKHVQDRVDQLINEKYTTKEIIEILKSEDLDASASYISSRRKKITKPEEINKKEEKVFTQISQESIQFIYTLMGMLGKNSLDETVRTIYNDYRTIIGAKYRFDIDNERSVSEVFNEFEESYRLFNKYAIDEPKLSLLIKRAHELADEEVLIINLTRNWPAARYSIMQQLRNGVPTWTLRKRLMDLYPEEIVQTIVDKLNQHESRGEVFQITIKNMNQVSVFPLTYDAHPFVKEKIE